MQDTIKKTFINWLLQSDGYSSNLWLDHCTVPLFLVYIYKYWFYFYTLSSFIYDLEESKRCEMRFKESCYILFFYKYFKILLFNDPLAPSASSLSSLLWTFLLAPPVSSLLALSQPRPGLFDRSHVKAWPSCRPASREDSPATGISGITDGERRGQQSSRGLTQEISDQTSYTDWDCEQK